MKRLLKQTELSTKQKKKDDKIQHGFEKYSRYWCILGGKVCEGMWIDGEEDEKRLSIGNAFHTKEEAEFALEKLKVIHELKSFAKPKDRRWDNNHPHYFISYNNLKKEIWVDDYFWCSKHDIYFDTTETVQKAIKAVGEDRIKKYYLEVE